MVWNSMAAKDSAMYVGEPSERMYTSLLKTYANAIRSRGVCPFLDMHETTVAGLGNSVGWFLVSSHSVEPFFFCERRASSLCMCMCM